MVVAATGAERPGLSWGADVVHAVEDGLDRGRRAVGGRLVAHRARADHVHVLRVLERRRAELDELAPREVPRPVVRRHVGAVRLAVLQLRVFRRDLGEPVPLVLVGQFAVLPHPAADDVRDLRRWRGAGKCV